MLYISPSWVSAWHLIALQEMLVNQQIVTQCETKSQGKKGIGIYVSELSRHGWAGVHRTLGSLCLFLSPVAPSVLELSVGWSKEGTGFFTSFQL